VPARVPDSLRGLTREIDAWISFGCPDRALAKLEPLLTTPGARPAGLALQIRALIELARYEEALDRLQELRGLGSDDEWLDVTEGWCHKRLDDLPAAIACMRRLVDRSHKSAIGHFNLGCYLALDGKTEEAIDEVTMACGLDQNFRMLAEKESDLESLRDHPRFQDLLPGTPPGGA
jgi:tetratricopeptide (TPR) repeat protein